MVQGIEMILVRLLFHFWWIRRGTWELRRHACLPLTVTIGRFPKYIHHDLYRKTELLMIMFCFSCLFFMMSQQNVLFFGGKDQGLSSPSVNFEILLPPPLCLHTHTNSESMKQPFATNPFVFTPPFPLNNVPKPNPHTSSTNLGHLLAANLSAAKRPTSHLKPELLSLFYLK